jgi:ATP/ADP translocase
MVTVETISNTYTTGAIIAIAVGAFIGLVIIIAVIIAIVCIIKHMKRSNNVRSQGMILQPTQPYQYPPNTMSVANYPMTTAPYTASAPNYAQPNYM